MRRAVEIFYIPLAIALVMAGFMAFVMAISAKADGAPKPSNWYASVSGGVNWDDVIDHPAVNNDPGAVVAGAVGTYINAVPGLRIEAELAFRTNETTVDFCGGGCGIAIDHDTVSILANAIYEVPVADGLNVYGLAGLGWANTEATVENIALARLEASGLAYQAGLGMEVTIAKGVYAGLSYRYLKTEEISVFGTQLSSGDNHAALVSLRFGL